MKSHPIEFRPMTESEFAEYRVRSVAEYAAEKERGEGLSQDEARKVSEESFAKLLPDGIRSRDQFVQAVIEKSTGAWVGAVWFAIRGDGPNRRAYLYDIKLDEAAQGKGYGKGAMLLLEETVLKLGLKEIGLHVFGHNTRARNLYEKLGYRATNIQMSKKLEG